MISRLKEWWLRRRIARAQALNKAMRGESSLRLAFADADAAPELKNKSLGQLKKLHRRFAHKALSARLSPQRAAAWDAMANRYREEIDRREAGTFLSRSLRTGTGRSQGKVAAAA
jgi:hypothetical protein